MLTIVDEAKKYLPDDINIKNLTRDYLICNMLIRLKYLKGYTKMEIIQVEVSQELSEKLKNFNPAYL